MTSTARHPLEHPQDVNLITIHKIGFKGRFSLFPSSKCISDVEDSK